MRRVLVASMALVAIAVNAPVASAASSVVVGPNVMVRPADNPSGASSASLKAARREFESFQIVVRNGSTGLTGLNMAVTGTLTGPGGATIPSSNITIYRQRDYNVSGFVSDGDLGGATGRFRDALVPKVDHIYGETRNAFPVAVPSNENIAAWVDVFVPAGTTPGAYTGASISVTATGYSATIPITVSVNSFTIPAQSSLRGSFDINVNRLCSAGGPHNCGSITGGGHGLLGMYTRVALDNRVSLAKPAFASPAYPANANYNSYVKPYLVGNGGGKVAGAKIADIVVYQWAKDSADEWKKLGNDDGYLDRITFHCDEVDRHHSLWTACRNDYNHANNLWKTAGGTPNVGDMPLQITASIDHLNWAKANGYSDLASKVNKLIPVINYMHPKDGSAFPGKRASYNAWLAENKGSNPANELYMYQSCMSMGCNPSANDSHSEWRGWPSYGVDQPAMQARAMGWLNFTYGTTGEYYYETARNLPTAWSNLWGTDGGNHGDGTFFYPGTTAQIGGTKEIPVESIRLKRVRDGHEDYEYLKHLKDTGKESDAMNIARGLFPVAYDTDKSQAALNSSRDALIDLLGGTAPPPPPSTSCNGLTPTIVGTAANDTLHGTAGNDIIAGLGGDDTIYGHGGDDIICGGDGFDTMYGGAGNDTLNGEAGGNAVDYGPSAGPVHVDLAVGVATGEGNDLIANVVEVYGSAHDDLIIGSTAANFLAGNGGNDDLYGGGGNDRLDGGNGIDTLVGGPGNDQLNGDAGIDLIHYLGSEGAVTVNLSTGTATGEGTDTITGIEDVWGSPYDDSLIGSTGNNFLAGYGGHDTIDGSAGDDRLDGGNGDDTLVGSGGVDVLNGDHGNDVLHGGVGNDTINGGDGVDTVDFQSSTAAVSVNLATGTATGDGSDTIADTENVTGSPHNDTLTGDSQANRLAGAGGDDTLVGGAGNDVLRGGDGFDTMKGGLGDDDMDGEAGGDAVDYGLSATGVTVNLGTGVATGEGNDIIVGVVEAYGSAQRDIITGDSAANFLAGNGGDDDLIGAAGNDLLHGGDGNDTLKGGLGNDNMQGQAGTDFVDYIDSATPVTVNLANGTATGEGTDTITGVEDLGGSQFADSLTGNDGNNFIAGYGGNDSIVGGLGADYLSGGAGDDQITSRETPALADAAVLCGAGNDTVTADIVDPANADCEAVNRA